MKRIRGLIKILFIFSIITFGCAPKISEMEKNALKKELKKMVEIDQVAAYIPQGEYKELTPDQWKIFKDSVFRINKNKIETIFNKHGFLGFDKVGQDGSNDFWLLVQHCDEFPKLQKDILRSMKKEVKRNNANPRNYAYLYDRVKINAGEKQLFGTQVDYEINSTARAIPKNGLVDSINVDKLRREYNLESLKDYLNQMTELHYEMNKEVYKEKGILPKLY